MDKGHISLVAYCIVEQLVAGSEMELWLFGMWR